MAKNDPNDVTGESAATAGEGRFTRAGRAAFEEYAPSAAAIGDAVAKALERQRTAPPQPQRTLPDIVRASVRCGYHTVRRVLSDGSAQMVTMPAEVTFKASETGDGREAIVAHGKPVKLKRDAFLRYEADGKVIAG